MRAAVSTHGALAGCGDKLDNPRWNVAYRVMYAQAVVFAVLASPAAFVLAWVMLSPAEPLERFPEEDDSSYL